MVSIEHVQIVLVDLNIQISIRSYCKTHKLVHSVLKGVAYYEIKCMKIKYANMRCDFKDVPLGDYINV